MYDVIVVGARCAGSSTALLLARSGVRVLLLERETLPRDTLNGHAILGAGARMLQRWGLLDPVLASGCQPFQTHSYDFGDIAFAGNPRWPDATPVVELAPRRYILDTLLAETASVAGAELRCGFTVDELLWRSDRVVGIRGHTRSGHTLQEFSQLVIGADGFRSKIAASVKAAEYETLAPATCLYYSHWRDLPTDKLEVYLRPGNYVVVFPSNDGLTCVGVGWSHAEFARVRRHVDDEFMAVIDRHRQLSGRVRAGVRAEPYRGMADLPMFLRTPHGPGWALVGDAGCRVDPITGQGITDAFRDAEMLHDAVLEGAADACDTPRAMAAYHRRRDAAVMPMFRFTAERARLQPPNPEMRRQLSALAGNQVEIDRFAGITAGTVSPDEFFAHYAPEIGSQDSALFRLVI